MKRRTVDHAIGLEIEWPLAGETISVPVFDVAEPRMLFRACAAPGHVYYCETCKAGLANVGQVEIHVEKGGYHRIVLWCGARRVYEAVAPLPDLRTGALA